MEQMDVQLLPIKDKKQIEEVVVLAETVWMEHYAPFLGEEPVRYMLKTYQSVEPITQAIHNGTEYFFVVWCGTIVGYTAIERKENILFLSKLYILNEYRGNGISHYIFDWLFATANCEKKTAIQLACNAENESSLAVYQHYGFVPVNDLQIDVGNGHVMHDYLMEKTL